MNRLVLVLSVCLALIALRAFGCETTECDIAALDATDLTQRFHGLGDSDAQYAKTVAKAIHSYLSGHGVKGVARYTDETLDMLVDRASQELTRAGDGDYATAKKTEWHANFSGGITRSLAARDIGEHPDQVLSKWLDDFYERIELVLGVDVCKMTHLSDIKTINTTVKIVIHPCDFGMNAVTGSRRDEYRRNFNEGEVYFGLTPVIVYWATTAGMAAAGAPIPFVASAAEFAYAKFLGGRLSDAIFDRQNCH